MAAIFPLPYENPGADRSSDLRYRNRRAVRPKLVVLQGGRRPPLHGRRLKRRRVAAVLALVTLTAVAVLGMGAVFAVVDAASQPSAPRPAVASGTQTAGSRAGPVIVVQAGDTLSSIARELQPRGNTSHLVDRLEALHGPGPLQAGDRLPVGSLHLAAGQ